MCLYKLDNLVDVSKRHANDGIGRSVVDSHPLPVLQRGAREYHVGHVALQLVRSRRAEDVILCPIEHLLWIVGIEEGGTHRVAVPVAGLDDAMVEHEPTFAGHERYRAGADLQALPSAVLKRRHLHHAAMLAPVLHVRAVADVDIAKRRMAVVARAAQHGEPAVNLFREEHAVAVERQKGVLALEEIHEIERVADADRGAMVTVAPRDPVAVFDPRHARVVFIIRVDHLRIARLELDRLMVDIPMDSVLAKTGKDIHLHRTVVATEHACEAILEGHYGAVEDTIGSRYLVTANHRIL